MPRFKGYSCLVAAALTAIALPAAAQEILRVPYITDIGSFDPDNAFEVGALSAINNVYEGLVEYAPGTTDIVGLLAEDFSVSDDGLTYTFDIVDGATFHDGTPVNAQAVLTALDRRGSDKMMLNYFLWNVTSITAPDDDTEVEVVLLDHANGVRGCGSGGAVGELGVSLGGVVVEIRHGCSPAALGPRSQSSWGK